MQTLLVVGNDKLGRKLIGRLAPNPELHIVLDVSSDIKRVIKLLIRGILSPMVLLKMFWAELIRTDYKIADFPKIQSNSDLINLIEEYEIKKMYLFRAGLIINARVLKTGVEVLNTHCASLSGYGGIGAIDRALRENALSQEATLHQVTAKIDSGLVIATQPYLLEKKRSYAWNEDRAYSVGMELILRQLTQSNRC